MEIYDLCGNDGLASGIYRLEFVGWSLSVGVCRLEFVGWSLSVGVCRCRAARGGLNFKIYGVCFDALRGGRRKFYRGSVVVLVRQWRPLALYAQLWQLKGVSDAQGFAALAAAAVAIAAR